MENYPMAKITAPGKVEFVDRRLPELGVKDVLIRVKACAICGGDLHIFRGKHPSAPLPVAIGHEVSGQVIKTGAGVTRIQGGDRVAVEPVITCGACHFCLRGQYHLCANISFQYRVGQGGFAPYFVVDENWAHILPEHRSYEQGALLEPLSVAVHAVRRAGLELGMTGAIFGDGAIGLLTLLVAKYSGGGKTFVTGIQEHRLRKAKQLGAQVVINNLEQDAVACILDGTTGMGVDRSFEAVGIETTLVQSLKVLKKGGTAVLLGIFEDPEVRLPANLFIQKEITLSGSQGYNWDFQRALKLAADKSFPLGELITHTLPLERLQDSFDLLLDEKNEAIKVVIQVD